MKYVSMVCLVGLILISSVSCAVGTHADPKKLPKEEVSNTIDLKEYEEDTANEIIISTDKMNEGINA